MKRLTLLFLFFAMSAPSASSQIFSIRLNGDKALKKYAKYTVDLGSGPVILGEIRSGITRSETGQLNWDSAGRSEWYIGDSSKPSSVAYRVKDGQRGREQKKLILGLPNSVISSVSTFSEFESFYSLSLEYQSRLEGISTLKAIRKSHDPSTQEFSLAHGRVVDAYGKLKTWLFSFGFQVAAEKLKKTIRKERMVIGKAAEIARARRSAEALVSASEAKGLTDAAKELGSAVSFRMQESQHFRIHYRDSLEDASVTRMLEFAENAMESFRQQFVDPYLSEGFEDALPEGRFVEWYFGPDDMRMHENMLTSFYGHGWGQHKEKSLKLRGTSRWISGDEPRFLYYWRTDETSDLFGIVAHNLGHRLAAHHYNLDGKMVSQDWLFEAVGYFVSLEFHGNNSVSCKAFEIPKENHTVAKGRAKEERETVGTEVVLSGAKQVYVDAALASGSPFQVLVKLKLIDMKNGDLGKAWSMFDYLAKNAGREGQMFLRALGQYSSEEGSFIRKVREQGELLFDSQGKDVFRLLDSHWKASVTEN